MNRKSLQSIASAILSGNADTVCTAIEKALVNETGAHWHRDLQKVKALVHDGRPRFTIIKEDGNSKLPFLAFSALPGAGACPGAGDCLEFCYSFRAWRYPSAFARQCQNTWLLNSAAGQLEIFEALQDASAKVYRQTKAPVDVRLYVDGDFRHAQDVDFWAGALKALPYVRAYGYSKSWQVLLDWSANNVMPANYILNLSSGSVYGADVKAKMTALPYVRGEFIAVSVGKKVTSDMHGTSDHNKVLRSVHGRKAFTCPGKCGSCTAKGHACGSERFKGLDIIIAVH